MSNLLTKSKDFTEEYCCSVVKVENLEDVPNSDNLKKTLINGEMIVVNKADVSEGDVMLYVSNECQISDWFLRANNMFRHYELNANRADVEARIKDNPDFMATDEGKRMVGYFEDNGRVRMIKLRGCPSFGVLFKPEAMMKALVAESIGTDHCVGGIDWTAMVGTDFDTIDDRLFVCAYVPKRYERRQHGMKGVSRWDRLDRMVPGQFKLHYDTAPLKKHLEDFKTQTEIDVTVKMHGTSFICGNVLTQYPLRFFKLRRWINKAFGTHITEARKEYGMVVSSRKVIKNEWGNSSHPEGFYGQGNDIWTEYGEIIYPYLPKGVTLYGEICGYLTDNAKMIQSGYDYGCKQGENFLMPYRVTQHMDDGTTKEYDIDDVIALTSKIKADMHDAGDKNVGRIFNIGRVRMYSGKIADIPTMRSGADSIHDMEHFPEALAAHCKIEKDEPLCKTKVPREGVVVRIKDDILAEAFKLKSMRFLEREKKAIDNGEVDMEMQTNTEQ